jgi:SNF family Na+-dependent transporter
MPFTFSHPAIILPLLKLSKNRLSATALVAGSMAPDFEYFLNFQMKQQHGHTLSGIIYYDLPIAILLCFAYHTLVRDAIIHYSPRILKSRWCHFIDYDWKSRWQASWKVIILSAIIGIASHLFWDSFTHPHRFMTEHIPFLNYKLSLLDASLSVHALLQVVCSILGLIAIGYALLKEPIKQEFRSGFRTKIIFWCLVLGLMLSVLILRNCQSLSDIIATSISGSLIGLMVSPALMKLLNHEEEQEIVF